jgi:hypothetical protein
MNRCIEIRSSFDKAIETYKGAEKISISLIEEALNNLHGDIWNIGYTTGVKVVDISEDECPECEYEVLDYEDGENNDT